jgi:hypothetical protein
MLHARGTLSRAVRHLFVPLGVIVAIGCSDDPKGPIGPPLYGVGGSEGTTGGSGGTGTGGSSGGSGGKGSGGNGGSGNEGGGGDAQGGNGGSSAGKGGSGGSGGKGSGGSGASGGKGGSAGKGGSSAGTGAVVTEPCEQPWSEPLEGGDCDLDALEPGDVTLTGDIDDDVTLESGKSYELSGPTRLLSGNTLTIEPCVKILGQGPDAVLAVLPGATIDAEGEPNEPIVMTSARAPGDRLPGDWGGVIILGNAHNNQASSITQPVIEGLVATEPFGSSTTANDDESSGTLAYVRIEFVGRDLGGGNETNGLTFGAVGRGTTVHHVMVSNSIDDCFEWFGGAVNASHLVAYNCDDDMFDADHGFGGTVQYAFGRQFLTTTESDSNGFELDGHPSEGVLTENIFTDARWSNVTLCGGGPLAQSPSPRIGAVLRRDAAGSIRNAVLTGFDTAGLSMNAATTTFTDSLFFDNYVLYAASHAGGSDWLENQMGNEAPLVQPFCDCWANPPIPFPEATIEGGDTDDLPSPDARFKGAFRSPAAPDNWMRGAWVDFVDE